MPIYQATHRIVREEWLTIEVEAVSEDEARRKAADEIEQSPYADYEVGDVIKTDDEIDVTYVGE